MTTPSATVLVVDDEPSLRHLLSQFLRHEGHATVSVGSGGEALHLLRTQPIDLVLLDMFMPEMNGLEVLAQIKADPALSDIPVVMISADQDIDGIATCLKLGAEDYLPKPFRPIILAARVNTCLERRRLRANERAYQARLETQVAERTAALAASEAALRQQSQILASILNSMSDGVVVVDTAGVLIHHNPAAEHIFGAQLTALLPQQSDAPSPLTNIETAMPYLADELPLAHAIRREAVADFTASFTDESGAQHWINITAQPLINDQQAIAGGVAVVRDISAAHQAAIALRESEERYMLAARGANDGLWDWDLRTNQAYFSPRWKLMLGYSEEEIGANPTEWLERIHPDDRERVEVHLAAHYQRLITHFQHEYRILHKDGAYRWVLCRGLAVWDEEGRAIRIAGSQTDISDRKHAEERLIHDALHDWLTDLPNRMLFQDRLEHALGRQRRNADYHFAVIFLDLDRFKVINDSLGHTVGDLLLKTVARRIERCVRPGDTVARLGGDEFTILLEDVNDAETALAITTRLQEAIAEPLALDDQEIFTTASIGITLSMLNYSTAEDLIRDADTAMYHAKMRGKARAVVFDPEMHTAAMHLLQIESALRWALQRNELRLHYQPIVALETGYVVGFEALVRWQHPERGLLLPNEFIGIAEETGLIVPIGWWVLHEACRQMRQWQQSIDQAATMWVTVNVSVKQLTQPDILDQIRQALADTALPSHSLRLEITESMLIEHSDRVADILDQIRALGIRVSMDDFGTGYSSLSYLQRLPVDALKIDRSFIKQLGITNERSEIVKAILSLAHAMGLQAVAEGTETAEQVEYLRDHSCELGQGWLYAKALDPQAIAALMALGQPLPGHPPRKTVER
jgi:diguanylate cyclase (GGDEF)-like protein/PAS domain S-box-containing protein